MSQTNTISNTNVMSAFYPNEVPIQESKIFNVKDKEFNTLGEFLEEFKFAYVMGSLSSYTNKDGKKIKSWNTHHKVNKRVRDDYPYEHSKYSMTYWNREDCMIHNKWILDKKLTGTGISVNIGHYPIFTEQKNSGDRLYKLIVLDMDSKESLIKFKDGYGKVIGKEFNLKDWYFTKSSTKKLPHLFCLVECDLSYPMKTAMSKNIWKDKVDEAIDIDFISDTNVFESINGKIYGSNILRLKQSQIKDIIIKGTNNEEFGIMWENNCKMNQFIDLNEIREKTKQTKKVNVKMIRTKRISKLEHKNEGGYKYSESDGSLHSLMKTFRVGGEEKIPFNILKELLYGLDIKQIEGGGYGLWKTIAFGVANQMTKTSNPYSYLNLFDKWIFDKFSVYESKYFEENEKIFELVLSNEYPTDKKVKCGTLWKLLYEQNRPLWVKLNFHKNKPLCPKEFCKLELEEYVEVMSRHIVNIKSNPPIYMEYDVDSHKWKSSSLPNFKTNYDEFFIKFDGKVIRDLGDKYHKSIEKTSFRHQDFLPFNKFGDTDKPCPYTTFNLFDGFEIDKDTDYDDVLEGMTQKEIEKELDFVLTHIRNLCGEDMNDEVYDFVLKYIAHIFKCPYVLPRVALVFTSLPGFGKNQLLRLIQGILGSKYYVSTQNSKLLFDTFNSLASHKLLVNLNEMDTNKKIMEEMKVFISEDEQSITKKYCETEIQKNRARTIIFSNKVDCLVIEGDDRRFMLMRSIRFLFTNKKYDMSCKENIARYNIELNRCVNSKWIQKLFYHYCLNYVNVDENYNFETNRVLTSEYKRLKEKNVSVFIKFCIWGYEHGKWDKKGSNGGYLTPKEYLNEFCEFREFMGWGKKSGFHLDYTELKSRLEDYKITDTDYYDMTTEKWLEAQHNKNKLFHNVNPKTSIKGLKSNQHKFKLMSIPFKNCCRKNGYDFTDNDFIDDETDEED